MTEARLSPQAFREISDLLFRWAGIRLYGKEQMVEGRLAPKLKQRGITFAQYVELLRNAGPTSPEGTEFINALTTNKTSFFRESHHFDYLRDVVFPRLRMEAAKGGSRAIRIWSAASSTGEEPYSLAMLCHAQLPSAQGWDVKILATDIDTNVIETARAARYDSIAGVPAGMQGYFSDPAPDGRRTLRPEIAKLVTFARANLIATPFPVKGSFHVVMCRNVMIYFDRPTQERVVANLTERIRPGGLLIVGHSESLVAPHLLRAPNSVGVYVVGEHAAKPMTGPLPKLVHSTNVPPPAVAALGTPPGGVATIKAPAFTAAAMQPQRKAGPAVPRRRHATATIAPPPPTPSLPTRSITVGEVVVSAEPMRLSTLLGSCVSACIFDPDARVGGMNHFLLPSSDMGEAQLARFGVHAMELLINKLMRLGADRGKLVAKVFGAARVAVQSLVPVADANATFVRNYLADEGIPILVERLGGTRAREISFETATGRVELREIASTLRLMQEEIETLAEEQKPVAAPAFNVDDALF